VGNRFLTVSVTSDVITSEVRDFTATLTTRAHHATVTANWRTDMPSVPPSDSAAR